jgi:protein TonB
MGYQALLFCPDEKTARTVTQVLSELDFNVTPCTEPFAAVKKLMGEHFDAVVVDCDNEQNATLLFKSARNTVNNQSSLAIAVVEGQAGVAKAFRIGANLVLTKPINVEQAKGTVRVARGLLRKHEGSKPATAAANIVPKPATPAQPPARPEPQRTISNTEAERSSEPIAPLAMAPLTSVPARTNASQPAAAAFASAEITGGIQDSETTNQENASPDSAKPSKVSAPRVTAVSAGLGTNAAASAPAPARELRPSVSNEGRAPGFVAESEIPLTKEAGFSKTTSSIENSFAPAPSFTFGGAVGTGAESRGGGKKALLGVAAAVLLAAAAYGTWMHWGHPNETVSAPGAVAAQPATTPATVPQAAPRSAPVAASSPASTESTPETSAASQKIASSKTSADKQTTASLGKTPAHPSKDVSEVISSKPSASTPATKAPATKEDAEPIMIKGGLSKPAAKAAVTNDAPALSITNIAPPANTGAMAKLMDSSSVPTPVLQKLNVSQGVSRGLLVKQVQPIYPASALRMHVEGSVQLLATLSKTGDISTVKVLSGDKQLAQAALTAVKQWKYKPYLLNGEPVEIQTEVTVNFKLPR